jgi:tetratricopeptide (TPR) repeat protein
MANPSSAPTPSSKQGKGSNSKTGDGAERAPARAEQAGSLESKYGAHRESFGRTIRDILIAAVLFVLALGIYYRHVQIEKQVNHIGKQAKDLSEKDTPQALIDATKDLDKVLDLQSSNPYGLSAHAEIDSLLWGEYGLADRKGPAEEFSRKADAIEAKIEERFAAHAYVLLYSGAPDKAEEYLVDLLKKGARGGAHILDALGRADRKQGKIDFALKFFTEATKSGWRIPRFPADLAQLYFDNGDLLNADNYFQKALELNADHPVSQIGRARTNIARGAKIKLATDDLASLLGPRKSELTPTLLAQAYTARAELKLFGKQYPEAVKDAQAAIDASGSYAPAYWALGMSLAHVDPQRSQAAFDKALSLDPYIASAYLTAARELVEVGQTDQAVALLKRFDKALTKDDHYYLIFGDLLERKGDPQGAMEQYDLALKATNNFSAPAWYAKGRLLQAQGVKQYPDAEKAYQAALAIQENYPEVHAQMGVMLMEAKKFEDAAAEFEQALEGLKLGGAPQAKMVAMHTEFSAKLKKAPKPLQKKFEEDAKVILGGP